MARLIAAQRQQQIVDLLKENGGYKIIDLAEHFQVSKETIRRDLIALNEKGMIQKSYGGAVATNYEGHPSDINEKTTTNADLKLQVCKKAIEFIPENAILYLDTGSTIALLASLLKEREDLTIITSSLSVVNAMLGSKCVVHVAGGQLDSRNQSFEGYQTTGFLSTIKVQLAFFGTNGFVDHHGPTTLGFLDAQTKTTMISNAQKSIVLADSSKSRSTAMNQYTTWRKIDHLIIDDGADPDAMRQLEEETNVIFA